MRTLIALTALLTLASPYAARGQAVTGQIEGWIFDQQTGEKLWQQRLPTSAHATPMTYRLGKEGRQFVVIAAGGHGILGTPPGDALMAFALPE